MVVPLLLLNESKIFMLQSEIVKEFFPLRRIDPNYIIRTYMYIYLFCKIIQQKCLRVTKFPPFYLTPLFYFIYLNAEIYF